MTSPSAPLFDAYGRYYDLLYQDKDYAAEVAYIVTLLERHGVSGRALLEFGSGTGKHGRLLAERGYCVTGIERSAEMVAQATPAAGFSCQQGDIRSVRLDRQFDAVLALFHVVSYQIGNTDVRAVLARAAEHLHTGGLFVFDVWYSPAVYAQKPEVRVKRLSDGELEIARIAEPRAYPNENRIDVHYSVYLHERQTSMGRVLTEIHPMRHFSLPELDLLAEDAGFERLAAEEFLSGAAPGEATWGVCVVLRKGATV